MALNVTRPSRFKSYGLHAILDNTAYTVYTCPPNTVAYMSLVFVSNASSSASDVSVEWNDDDSGTPIVIIGGKNLAQAEFIQLSGSFLVLEENDTLKMTTANTAGGNDPDVSIIVTVEEVFLPNG